MLQGGKHLGVIVWPPAIQHEGIEFVLDNLQTAGVTSVSTSPYVAAPAEDGEGARREPPDDGGRGMDRVIERPLWGQKSLYLRTSSSYIHDERLYSELKYAPPPVNELTEQAGGVIKTFIESAKRRGIKTYLQVHVSHLPRLRADLDESERLADMPRLPSGAPPSERMVNFAALSSPDVQAFFAAEIRDLLAAYPGVDGLLLDRAEQSVYTLHDAFVDFGPHARRLAGQLGYDFEPMTAAAQALLDDLPKLTNEDLSRLPEAGVPLAMLREVESRTRLREVLNFRAALTTRYLHVLRDAADSVRPGVELLPITFPPPLSVLTGADFRGYSSHADAALIKFFTMHWPLIVTYWAQAILAVNPSLDPGMVCRAISKTFDFEDSDWGESLGDYTYPGPEQPHRAGTDAQLRKIRAATAGAGDMPVFPSVHAYGPLDDVGRRFRVGWEGGAHGMWVNRYGYLSDEKLTLLGEVARS